MQYKEYKLSQDIKRHTQQEEFYKKQAKSAKYASIFAGCDTGIATIVAIMHAIESGITDNDTLLFTMAAIGFGIITNVTYETYKNNKHLANKYRNKIRTR